jgi:hypothetical protein
MSYGARIFLESIKNQLSFCFIVTFLPRPKRFSIIGWLKNFVTTLIYIVKFEITLGSPSVIRCFLHLQDFTGFTIISDRFYAVIINLVVIKSSFIVYNWGWIFLFLQNTFPVSLIFTTNKPTFIVLSALIFLNDFYASSMRN